jgi:hypothetical protein
VCVCVCVCVCGVGGRVGGGGLFVPPLRRCVAHERVVNHVSKMIELRGPIAPLFALSSARRQSRFVTPRRAATTSMSCVCRTTTVIPLCVVIFHPFINVAARLAPLVAHLLCENRHVLALSRRGVCGHPRRVCRRITRLARHKTAFTVGGCRVRSHLTDCS